ncbi:hypothetical protein ACHAW5_002560 [Stephanodiscus triporus]|uniref:Uncharacterized protein n=1 Tax=Stephanodiscus triporus TaxID=2934178 RepID=A0ABD3MSW6_9STRA
MISDCRLRRRLRLPRNHSDEDDHGDGVGEGEAPYTDGEYDLPIVPLADYFDHGSEYEEIIYHLLARYGFLNETCPATYCKLLPPTVNRDMLNLGYLQGMMLFYRNGEVADKVWDIFVYSYLVSVDVNKDVRALMNAHHIGRLSSKLALHEQHYPTVSAALLEHVNSFIEEIDVLIAKAEKIEVRDPNLVFVCNEHPRLPLIHRLNLLSGRRSRTFGTDI